MPTAPQSDLAELVRRARDGDAAARDGLFEACRSYVVVLARAELASWLRAKVDASDLVQQSLLDAHQDLQHFEGRTEQEWLAWLRRIVTHNAADLVRRYHGAQKRRIGREVPLRRPDDSSRAAAGHEPIDSVESPSAYLMQWESQLQLADAIARLPDDYQEVVILRNLQHLPFHEVAERMGRSRPATQMLWMRAIRRLRELMGRETDE